MKKLCLCILSLLVLLAVLAACRGGEEQPPEPELVSYHVAEYTIVRPEKADDALVEAVRKVFDLRPAAIIRDLGLRRPIYRPLAAYGHMGREDLGVAWEKTDRAEALKEAVENR